VRVTLQLVVSQSVSQSVSHSFSHSVLALSPFMTHAQIFVIVSTVAVLFVVGRSLRREDGSVM
jgi:hypothetical protein